MRLKVGLTPWREPSLVQVGNGFAEQAVRAEELGFHSIWIPESHFVVDALPAPLLLLAAAATLTRTLRLGTTSLLLSVRRPILLAEELAVLDGLSRGRLIVGVGRGFRNDLFSVLGLDPKDKRSRLAESLKIMKAAWAGEILPSSLGCKTETVVADRQVAQGPRLVPLPLQRPHPPLWMAAFGPLALQQAARHEMPYLASPLESVSQLATNYARLDEFAESMGKQTTAIRPIMRTVFCSADEALCRRVNVALEEEQKNWARTAAPILRESLAAPLSDRVLVCSSNDLGHRLARVQEQIGMSLLIARCRVPGASESEIEASVESLARVAESFA